MSERGIVTRLDIGKLVENDSLNKKQLFDENVLNIYLEECIFGSAKRVSRSTRIFSDNSFKDTFCSKEINFDISINFEVISFKLQLNVRQRYTDICGFWNSVNQSAVIDMYLSLNSPKLST